MSPTNFSLLTYTVWAPNAHTVDVQVNGTLHSMFSTDNGWWDSAVARRDGDRYGFILDHRGPFPDPRGVSLPDGVHELSQAHTLNDAVWTDSDWPGIPLTGAIFYELHIGTFTPEGTLDSAISRLDYLVELGITIVELMPVNAFNGTWGWGYDGVNWYTVHNAYGGPDALQRFVNACHIRGLGVFLDVVYNHLGPSGNYLSEFGPYLSEFPTQWGQGLNISGEWSSEVRSFIIDNAIHWFTEFHIDGLRLDAVHAIIDDSPVHLLAELSQKVSELSTSLNKPLSLVAESDLNDPLMITPTALGELGMDAQWNDDFHHALHTTVSGESAGYYPDFASAGLKGLADVLVHGFFHRGSESTFSAKGIFGFSTFRGKVHGKPIPTSIIEPSALLAYTTTHDQVGNRARGDRPSMNLSPGLLGIKAALVLLSPFTPMLFMGEEWGASTPFAFFSSHPEKDLARAVTEGRLTEFAAMDWDTPTVLDPQDPKTFMSSKLDWSEVQSKKHRQLLDVYRKLIALRGNYDTLLNSWLSEDDVSVGEDVDSSSQWITIVRSQDTRSNGSSNVLSKILILVANIGDGVATVPLPTLAVPTIPPPTPSVPAIPPPALTVPTVLPSTGSFADAAPKNPWRILLAWESNKSILSINQGIIKLRGESFAILGAVDS